MTRVFLNPFDWAALDRPVPPSLRLDERRAAVMARCLDRLRQLRADASGR